MREGEDKAHRGREKARAKENDPGNAEDQRHPKFGKPDILYPYFDAAGRPVFYVARWDRTKGERGKEIRPLHWNGRAWDWSDPKGLLPFYNMIEVMAHSDKPVMIHEGENKGRSGAGGAAAIRARSVGPWLVIRRQGGLVAAVRAVLYHLARPRQGGP